MPLIPISLPPGLKRSSTLYGSRGRWYDGNLVRFFEGDKRPVGGWVPLGIEIVGRPRAIHAWRTTGSSENGGGSVAYLAIGTHKGIFAYVGGTTYDLTGIGTVQPGEESSGGQGRPYGTGLYGFGPYSGAGGAQQGGAAPGRPLQLSEAGQWILDNFGDYLVGVLTPSDGVLRFWDLDPTGSMAPVVATAGEIPTDISAVIATPERFLFVLKGNTVYWPSQEGFEDWDFTSDANTAGQFSLTTEGRLMAGLRMPRETLLFTDTDVHSAVYIGGDLLYQFDRRGAKCGLLSPHSAVAVGDVAFWMSEQGFFRYDGAVNPIPCENFDFIYSNLNRVQSLKTYAVSNSQYREVWWFYCSGTSDEVDSYACYNYQEGHWTTGKLARSCGVDRGVFPFPIWCSPTPLTGLTSTAFIGGTDFVSELATGKALSTLGWDYDEHTINHGGGLITSRYHGSIAWSFRPPGLLCNPGEGDHGGKFARRPKLSTSTKMTALMERSGRHELIGVQWETGLILKMQRPGPDTDPDRLCIVGGIQRDQGGWPTGVTPYESVRPFIRWVDANGISHEIGMKPYHYFGPEYEYEYEFGYEYEHDCRYEYEYEGETFGEYVDCFTRRSKLILDHVPMQYHTDGFTLPLPGPQPIGNDDLIVQFEIVPVIHLDTQEVTYRAELRVGFTESPTGALRLVRVCDLPEELYHNSGSGVYLFRVQSAAPFAYDGVSIVKLDGERVIVGAQVFEHERGSNHPGADQEGDIFLESGPLEIGVGDNVYMIRHIYPDEKALGDLKMKVFGAFHPTGPEREFGPFSAARPTAARITARQMRLRLYPDADGKEWRAGDYRFDGELAGER